MCDVLLVSPGPKYSRLGSLAKVVIFAIVAKLGKLAVVARLVFYCIGLCCKLVGNFAFHFGLCILYYFAN